MIKNENKIVSVVIAVASVFLFFQPFVERGMFIQNGMHWGGLTYALLVLPSLYALSVWFNQKALAFVFSIACLLLSGNYLLEVGDAAAFGLQGIALGALFSFGISFTVSSQKPA